MYSRGYHFGKVVKHSIDLLNQGMLLSRQTIPVSDYHNNRSTVSSIVLIESFWGIEELRHELLRFEILDWLAFDGGY
jgi:hypothetical protein